MSNDVKLEPWALEDPDIVERLRDEGMHEAADEIESLQDRFEDYATRHQPQEREAVLEEAVVRTFAEGLWAEARKRGEMRPEYMPSSRTDFLDEARKQLTSLTTPAPAVSRDEIVAVLERCRDREHNPFEPDNQTTLHGELCAILSRLRGER